MMWYGVVWLILIVWYYAIWCDMMGYDSMWSNMIWYDMIWYDMIWYDMRWYRMIWYDMIWYNMMAHTRYWKWGYPSTVGLITTQSQLAVHRRSYVWTGHLRGWYHRFTSGYFTGIRIPYVVWVSASCIPNWTRYAWWVVCLKIHWWWRGCRPIIVHSQ